MIMGFYKPDGELIWLSIDCQPLFQESSSEPYALVVSFTEITKPQDGRMEREVSDTKQLIQDRKAEQLILLLVEDNPEDREMYRRYLQSDLEERYFFVEAKSGEEALEICQQDRPDLVLLDYLLPDMDGLELLARWQQQNGENCPPIIVLTGQGDETIAAQFLKLGASNYLVKGQLTSEKLQLEIKRSIAEYRLRIQHQKTSIELFGLMAAYIG
jgi:CheY-like chemotaxis protein